MPDLRHLLLLLDDGAVHAPAVAQAACALARAHGARLEGLAPTGFAEPAPRVDAAATLAELAGTSALRREAAAERAIARFEADCRDAGIAAVATRLLRADSHEALLRAVHCCDLLLLARPQAATRAATEALLQQAARPVLLLPQAPASSWPPRRAWIAWDDSGAAARAVADALPLLARCERVVLAGWHALSGHAATRHGLERLAVWLGHHGIATQPLALPLPEGGGVGDALLSRTADDGAELLVMGAWGHARWAERLLGGTTRTVLDAPTLPVLMSH